MKIVVNALLSGYSQDAVAEANAYLFADFELDAGGDVSYFIEVRALRVIMPGEEILARYCRVQDEQGGIYYRR